ncbi:MAG: MFS transporter [Saprospiraceae bacterium]
MENSIQKKNSQIYILIFSATIAAFGPIVTDLYLPAMPQMNKVFDTTTSFVQLSLTLSLLGLGAGQLLFGPISDKYGRKTPLVISLFLFIISTLGCVLAWNIESLCFF